MYNYDHKKNKNYKTALNFIPAAVRSIRNTHTYIHTCVYFLQRCYTYIHKHCQSMAKQDASDNRCSSWQIFHEDAKKFLANLFIFL